MTANPDSDFAKAVRETFSDPTVQNRHPKGMSSVEILYELNEKFPGAFPLCSVIDVADEMQEMYG